MPLPAAHLLLTYWWRSYRCRVNLPHLTKLNSNKDLGESLHQSWTHSADSLRSDFGFLWFLSTHSLRRPSFFYKVNRPLSQWKLPLVFFLLHISFNFSQHSETLKWAQRKSCFLYPKLNRKWGRGESGIYGKDIGKSHGKDPWRKEVCVCFATKWSSHVAFIVCMEITALVELHSDQILKQRCFVTA